MTYYTSGADTREPAPRGSPKTLLVGMALTFAVVVAVIVGNRLSDQALAVLAGSVCGVGAALPTSLIILAISRWRNRPDSTQPTTLQPMGYPYTHPQQSPGQGYPPVIIVAPPQAQQWGSPYPTPFGPPVEREFTVVGGEGKGEDILRKYPV
ncbi:MAG: hypothetical protein JXA14_26165 [Anaerolineae bacterium]|nr:hypothetical protein [Anaerolineae bacterium]